MLGGSEEDDDDDDDDGDDDGDDSGTEDTPSEVTSDDDDASGETRRGKPDDAPGVRTRQSPRLAELEAQSATGLPVPRRNANTNTHQSGSE